MQRFRAISMHSVKKLFQQFASISIAIVFIVSAFDKSVNFSRFERVIAGQQIVPYAFITPVAVLVVFCELFVGAALMVSKYRRHALLGAIALLCVFLFILLRSYYGGSQDCGCGNLFSAFELPVRIAQDAVMLLVAGIAWMLHERNRYVPQG